MWDGRRSPRVPPVAGPEYRLPRTAQCLSMGQSARCSVRTTAYGREERGGSGSIPFPPQIARIRENPSQPARHARGPRRRHGRLPQGRRAGDAGVVRQRSLLQLGHHHRRPRLQRRLRLLRLRQRQQPVRVAGILLRHCRDHHHHHHGRDDHDDHDDVPAGACLQRVLPARDGAHRRDLRGPGLSRTPPHSSG